MTSAVVPGVSLGSGLLAVVFPCAGSSEVAGEGGACSQSSDCESDGSGSVFHDEVPFKVKFLFGRRTCRLSSIEVAFKVASRRWDEL